MESHANIHIRPARYPDDLELIRALFREYAAWLNIDLGFQQFERELKGLPGAYGPPRGACLLVEVAGAAAGCVALRPLPDGAPGTVEMERQCCEMKRMWVREGFRGLHLGRRLAVAILDEARRLGYGAMRLDTLERLTAANRLYESLGFRDIPAYYHNPEPGARFMEMKLS